MIVELLFLILLQVSPQQLSNDLILAARHGDLSAVSDLLDQGADVDFRHALTGWTPLATACFYAHSDIAKLLVEKGADVNATDRQGGTPLMKAVAMPGGEQDDLTIRKVEILKLLLASGADPQLKDKLGSTAWQTALILRQQKLLDVFAEAGVRGVRESLLLEAIALQDEATVQRWIDAGSDLDYRDDAGWTSLGEAVLSGSPRMVELILKGKADPNARQERNWTPLMIAASRNDVPIAKQLLDAGADSSLQDDSGSTALDIARASNHVDVAAFLEQPKE